MTDRFQHLLQPGRIGALELRNRIVLCPMGVLFGNEDGSVSENEAAFYEARARGGAGLLIVGTACVAYPRGTNHERMPAVSHDRYLPGMAELAERVHRHGARLAAQLNYMGVYSFVDMVQGRRRLVPYEPAPPRPDRLQRMVSREETMASAAPFLAEGAELGFDVADEADIAWVIERFVDAADRCQRAGYDGVELHAGHGYLIDEFLSPRNTRTDAWGGPIEGRAKLLVDVVRAIRARLGAAFPVWMRINAIERHHTVGEAFDEQCRAIELAIEAGVDAVHLTAYANTDVATNATDSYAPHVVGPLQDYAAQVKARFPAPVITFGRLEPDEAEAVVAGGKADFVAMGRKLLADPDLPNKLAAGRVDDVRPCIYQYRCIGNITLRVPARCVVNPQTGREHDLALTPAASARHVLVVGGGPAGLEAARLLAERGHRVLLREASHRLGGRLAQAALADPILDAYLGWLVHQVSKADVAIELGAPVDGTNVPAGMDEIVVATGASWDAPAPDGNGNVLTLDELAPWLLDDGPLVESDVLVIGHGKAAMSIAELCANRGRTVTAVSPTPTFAAELGLPGRYRLLAELERLGVRLLTGAEVEQLHDGEATVRVGTERHTVAAATAIGIAPSAPRSALADEFGRGGVPVHRIGDCDRVGLIEHATTSALAVARAIG